MTKKNAPPTPEEFAKMTVSELRAVAATMNLPQAGSRQTLLARVKGALKPPAEASAPEAPPKPETPPAEEGPAKSVKMDISDVTPAAKKAGGRLGLNPAELMAEVEELVPVLLAMPEEQRKEGLKDLHHRSIAVHDLVVQKLEEALVAGGSPPAATQLPASPGATATTEDATAAEAEAAAGAEVNPSDEEPTDEELAAITGPTIAGVLSPAQLKMVKKHIKDGGLAVLDDDGKVQLFNGDDAEARTRARAALGGRLVHMLNDLKP